MRGLSTRSLWFLAAAAVLFGVGIFIRYHPDATSTIWSISQGGQWLFPLITVAALIDSINPCAFSILLLTIAFLFSINQLRSKVVTVGSFYILGLFAVYMLIGLGLFQTLHIFNTPHFMAKLGAALLIALGIANVIGVLFPAFPIRFQIPARVHRSIATLMEKGSLPTAFALGALVGLCEFPCTGGPYLTAVGLLHDNGTYITGLAYLGYYNLLFVLPLIIMLVIASDSRLLEKVRHWQKTNARNFHLWGGIMMLALAVIILLS